MAIAKNLRFMQIVVRVLGEVRVRPFLFISYRYQARENVFKLGPELGPDQIIFYVINTQNQPLSSNLLDSAPKLGPD